MNQFRYSICEPLNPEIIEKGTIDKNQIVALFKNYDWEDFLKQAEKAMEKDIYYSPSLEFENLITKHGLCFSAIGAPNNPEFLVFYKRPKKVKKWFGFGKEKLNEHYMSELNATQTIEEATVYLQALIDNRLDYLDDKIR